MNKITIILILFILLTGCRTTKKAVKQNTQAKTETVTKTENTTADQVKEEKNLNTETVTTITEVEYNQPDTRYPAPCSTPVGSIKSTKTTVIKTVQSDRGKIETAHKQDIKTETDKTEETKTKVEVTEKSKSPVQWWAIFGILAIFTSLVVYFKFPTLIKNIFR